MILGTSTIGFSFVRSVERYYCKGDEVISERVQEEVRRIAERTLLTLMTRMMFRNSGVYSEGWAIEVIEKAITEGAVVGVADAIGVKVKVKGEPR